MQLEYKKSTLKNGIRVISIPMKNTAAVTSLILVRSGSHYEPKKLSGIFHHLEHLVFKGSKKYPEHQKLKVLLDALGGSYNAFTSFESTGFYITTTADKVEKGIDIMSDFLRNPLLPPKEVQKEKGPIIEELRIRHDVPQEYATELFLEVMFGNQAAGRSIGGSEDTIKKITRDDLQQYFEKFYTAENTVVVFAGNLSHTKAKNIARKFFSTVSSGAFNEKPIVTEPIKKTKSKVIVDYRKIKQTPFILGFWGVTVEDERRYPLILLADILGGGLSSRLFTEVRDKRGWAYTVHSGISAGSDYGIFEVGGGLNNLKVKDALRVIIKELKKIKKAGVNKGELRSAKDRFRTGMLLGLETSQSVASYIGRQELLSNRVRSLSDVLDYINRVRTRDIQEVANDIFKKDAIRLALVGPHKNKEELEKIISTI